jgi:hypothetical protein
MSPETLLAKMPQLVFALADSVKQREMQNNMIRQAGSLHLISPRSSMGVFADVLPSSYLVFASSNAVQLKLVVRSRRRCLTQGASKRPQPVTSLNRAGLLRAVAIKREEQWPGMVANQTTSNSELRPSARKKARPCMT